MDTLMTIIPIAVAIASGTWIAHSRKHNKPWIRIWLKAMTVLIGVPIGAWCLFMALGFTDANVKWLILPLSFMLLTGIASFAGVAIYTLFTYKSTYKHEKYKQDSVNYGHLRLKAPGPLLFLWTFRNWW